LSPPQRHLSGEGGAPQAAPPLVEIQTDRFPRLPNGVLVDHATEFVDPRNPRRPSQPAPVNRLLSDRGDAGDSWTAGPTKQPYLMTDSTMIQARMATATLLANTSGTNRSQLSLDQGACVGSRSGQVAARERRLPYRLVAKLSRGGSWEAMEFPSWRSSRSPFILLSQTAKKSIAAIGISHSVGKAELIDSPATN
jgi:hypothetical protein